MARPNLLRQKQAAGRTCVGPIFQEFWSPELFEFCGLVGFDYVIVDGEHAGVDPRAARELVRAAQGVGITALARVPRNEPSLLMQYLDAGVEGLILPHCNTTDDAQAFVSACKYPPSGIRGAASSSRAAGYGLTQKPLEHLEQADHEVLCLGALVRRACEGILRDVSRRAGAVGFRPAPIAPGAPRWCAICTVERPPTRAPTGAQHV